MELSCDSGNFLGLKDRFQKSFPNHCRVCKKIYPQRKGEPEAKKPLLEPVASTDDTFEVPFHPSKNK